MTPRSVGAQSLARRRGLRRERPRLLIVAEGEKTERQYFEGLLQFARATGVDLCSAKVVGLGRDPQRVVAEAIRRREEDRRSSPDDDRYSQVWCVFDVDRHEHIHEAVGL